jgi:hypothetical protein
MAELITEQLIYLLYTSAYVESETVTKSTVKSYLPSEWKSRAETIYNALQTQELIKQKSKGRFSLTDKGEEALVTNLINTDYKFESIKGPKVLNTLLVCIRKAAETQSKVKLSEEMAFDKFREKFKALYFEERRQQELRGVVAIYSHKLLQMFAEQNSVSQNKINQYYDLLKTNRNIFTVVEKEHELIEWAE